MLNGVCKHVQIYKTDGTQLSSSETTAFLSQNRPSDYDPFFQDGAGRWFSDRRSTDRIKAALIPQKNVLSSDPISIASRPQDGISSPGLTIAHPEFLSKLAPLAINPTIACKVIQVFPNGVLATRFNDGKTVFIKGITGAVDEDRIEVRAIRDGTYTYTSVLGAARTVECWVSGK